MSIGLAVVKSVVLLYRHMSVQMAVVKRLIMLQDCLNGCCKELSSKSGLPGCCKYKSVHNAVVK